MIPPEEKVTIKDADLPSMPLMAALTEAAGGDPWSAEALEKILALPHSFGLLALTPVEPLGFLLAQAAADESEIINLAVAPAARRRGIGRSLLAEAMERARTGGARAMFLEVASDNEAARALYESVGFEQVGIRPDYYRIGPINYMDAFIFRCDLITAGGTGAENWRKHGKVRDSNNR